jgi:hypothetical protein
LSKFPIINLTINGGINVDYVNFSLFVNFWIGDAIVYNKMAGYTTLPIASSYDLSVRNLTKNFLFKTISPSNQNLGKLNFKLCKYL